MAAREVNTGGHVYRQHGVFKLVTFGLLDGLKNFIFRKLKIDYLISVKVNPHKVG